MNSFIDANLIKVKNNVEQTANTGKTTLRNMDANAPLNKHLVNKVYTANCCEKRPFLKDALVALYKRFGLPISDNLFKKEFIQIDNLEDLQKLITEVFIRFDTNPHFYNKEDYFTLLRLISQSLLFLYLQHYDLIIDVDSLPLFNINNNIIYRLKASDNTYTYHIFKDTWKQITTLDELIEELSKKQDTLISGENIKTINTQSILGNGNIDAGKAYTALRRVKNYLYQAVYDNIDYEFATKYFQTKRPNLLFGACSTVRNNNFIGRNYDWFYRDDVSFVVNTPRSLDHYASISISTSIPLLKEEYMLNNNYNEESFKILPFFALDGINEYGVSVSDLVVPAQYGETSGTTPSIEKREEICNIMLVRYILDKFKTAFEAVDYIKKYVSVFTLNSLKEANYDLHYMISDKEKSYVLEFINNEVVYKDITNKPYMTNFFLHNVNFSTESIDNIVPVGGVYTPETINQGYLPSSLGITSHGDGLERYNLIVSNYNTANTKEGMQNLMFNDYDTNNLRYTQSYRIQTTPQWNTEFTGIWDIPEASIQKELTVDTPAEEFEDVKEYIRDIYETGERSGKTWFTEHSSVYDIDKRKLYLIVQEDGEELEFDLNYYTKQEIDNKIMWTKGEGENAVITKSNYISGGSANGDNSVAEGFNTHADALNSHAEGNATKVFEEAVGAHAEGIDSNAKGPASHVEGQQSESIGGCSHAEGGLTMAIGDYSHSEGNNTFANNNYEHAEGHFNISNQTSLTYGNEGNTIHSIGIGNSLLDKKNAVEVMLNGDQYIIGIGGYNGKNFNEAKTIQEVINSLADYIKYNGYNRSDIEVTTKFIESDITMTYSNPKKSFDFTLNWSRITDYRVYLITPSGSVHQDVTHLTDIEYNHFCIDITDIKQQSSYPEGSEAKLRFVVNESNTVL